MRVWDIPVKHLCMQHLLGEHNEIHTIWSIITNGKKGFAHHPETMRWRGRLGALIRRHDEVANELQSRSGNAHKTPLDSLVAASEGPDTWIQERMVESVASQIENLRRKACKCNLTGMEST